MGGDINLIERYAFISFEMWGLVKDIFPKAVTYGNSKIVQYASPMQSNVMRNLVLKHNLPLIEHEYTDSEMIINAIETGIDKVYNCNHDVALEVCDHFSPKDPEIN